MTTTAEDAIRRLVKAVMNSTGEERERLIKKHAGTLRSEHVYQLTQKRIDKLQQHVRNLETALAEVRKIMATRQDASSGAQPPSSEQKADSRTGPASDRTADQTAGSTLAAGSDRAGEPEPRPEPVSRTEGRDRMPPVAGPESSDG